MLPPPPLLALPFLRTCATLGLLTGALPPNELGGATGLPFDSGGVLSEDEFALVDRERDRGATVWGGAAPRDLSAQDSTDEIGGIAGAASIVGEE